LPKGWEWERLGDVTQINPRNYLSDDLDVSFVPMALIEDGFQSKHKSEMRKWDEIKSGFTHFKENDVAVAKITPCFQNRKSAVMRNLTNGYGAGTTELYVIRTFDETFVPELLLLLFKSNSFIEGGVNTFTGTAGQQRVKKEYMEHMVIGIPPAIEQKRIKTEKEKLIAEGKIKKEKPLPPISEDEIPYKLPKGWKWVRLGEIVKKMGAGSTPKGGKAIYQDNGIKFIRSQNVWNNGLNLHGVAHIPKNIHDRMNGTIVQSKDILLNITGASIGRCALVLEEFDEANVSQHVTIIRVIEPAIRQFIHKCLISSTVQKNIMDVQVGISREGLSMTRLREFLLPIPPLAEQKRIVTKVDQLMKLCDELETKLNQSKKDSEMLMQTVLQEAFERNNTER
jgi:restriction endonuclease S subunit